MEVITRKEAKAKGLKKYYTGKPCKKGHLAERRTATPNCIICSAEYRKKWYIAYPEKESEYRRKYKAKHISQVAEADHRYYLAHRREWAIKRECFRKLNPEKWREYALKHYRKNLAKERIRQNQWRLKNLDYVALKGRQYRARKIQANGNHILKDITDIFEKQQGECACCRKSIKGRINWGKRTRKAFAVDHIVPLSKGGSNWPWNLQLLCHPCNSSKRDKNDGEWKTKRVVIERVVV